LQKGKACNRQKKKKKDIVPVYIKENNQVNQMQKLVIMLIDK